MIRLYAITLLAVLALAGCGGNKYEREGYAFGCPVGMEKKISDKEELVEAKLEPSGHIPYVEVQDIRCAERGPNMRIEVDLYNEGSDVHRVAYRFRWLDKEGMQAWDEEAWKPLMIYAKTRHTIYTTTPSQEATDFRIMLRSLDQP